MAPIVKVATDVISIWEHGGLYTCHGNGAYGLIGFQFDNVTQLLRHYIQLGGSLQNAPAWYANELKQKGKGINAELDQLAHTALMQKAQRDCAEAYMKDAINIQKKYYDFKMPLSQLILCDMGVNNGKWNHYVEDVDVSGKNEYQVIMAAQSVRIDAVKRAGEWHYKGLQKRYKFYHELCKGNHHLTMKKYCPVLEVNGYNVHIGDEVTPL